jgi:hypothetical protein
MRCWPRYDQALPVHRLLLEGLDGGQNPIAHVIQVGGLLDARRDFEQRGVDAAG